MLLIDASAARAAQLVASPVHDTAAEGFVVEAGAAAVAGTNPDTSRVMLYSQHRFCNHNRIVRLSILSMTTALSQIFQNLAHFYLYYFKQFFFSTSTFSHIHQINDV